MKIKYVPVLFALATSLCTPCHADELQQPTPEKVQQCLVSAVSRFAGGESRVSQRPESPSSFFAESIDETPFPIQITAKGGYFIDDLNGQFNLTFLSGVEDPLTEGLPDRRIVVASINAKLGDTPNSEKIPVSEINEGNNKDIYVDVTKKTAFKLFSYFNQCMAGESGSTKPVQNGVKASDPTPEGAAERPTASPLLGIRLYQPQFTPQTSL